jgi:hypothetical protein
MSNNVVTSTIRSFSERTGISRSYDYVLLGKGELESSKIGGVRLIHEDSFVRLLERTRIRPKGKAPAHRRKKTCPAPDATSLQAIDGAFQRLDYYPGDRPQLSGVGHRRANGHTGAAAQSRNGRDTALCTRPVGSSLHIAVGDDHGMIAESN